MKLNYLNSNINFYYVTKVLLFPHFIVPQNWRIHYHGETEHAVLQFQLADSTTILTGNKLPEGQLVTLIIYSPAYEYCQQKNRRNIKTKIVW